MLTEAEFKAALGSWPSGVTVVTTRAQERVHGMTVSAFGSVSLHPPLISVCLDAGCITLQMLRETRVFAVNILSTAQAALSNHFASKATEAERLRGIDYREGSGGCPILVGVSAALECDLYALHDAGDHVLILGEVRDVQLSEANPLLYHARRYGRFTGE